MATSMSQATSTAKPTNLPLHTSSHDPNKAPVSPSISKRSAAPAIAIPDARRNSLGESMHSPCETWKPDFNRTQSWNSEDLKRRYYVHDLSPVMQKNATGEEKGFTEVVAETSDDSEASSPLEMRKGTGFST